MTVLASYLRAGGLPPADDERLEVEADGTWTLWRTMGGPCVGAFGGRLDAGRRRRLQAAVDAVADAGTPDAAADTRPRRPPPPDGVHESFTAGEEQLDLAAGAPAPGAWGPLVRLLRDWSATLAEPASATTALELGDDDGQPLLLRHGPDHLVVWPATLRVEVYARDRDGIVRDRVVAGKEAEGDVARGEPLTTGPGWSLDVDIPRLPVVPDGGRLEAWVWLDVAGPDGPARVRLVSPA
jgi:hypothetical protein